MEVRVALFGFLGVSSFLIAGIANAAPVKSDRELIVRYRQPQNTSFQASMLALATAKAGLAKTEILNGPEGVLKLRFDSADSADQARARLELSGEVLSVSPNLMYRPSIRYNFKKSMRAASAGNTFLAIPFVSLTSVQKDLPEVALPPTSSFAGMDPLAAQDWALPSIRLPELADLGDVSGLAPITAAVIDTGIDYNHEDLAAGLWRHPDNASVVGRDFAHDTDTPYDVLHFDIEGCIKDLPCSLGMNQGQFLTNPGHGTHCAGHVGAVANNSLGMRGVGSNRTQVMGLKFFYDAGEEKAGQGDDAAAIKSIDYAVDHGAKVISASWGGNLSHEDAEASELKQSLIRAQKAGVLVVIAAGNESIDQDEAEAPSYPAAYDLDNLIVVAASDQNDKLAKFSNYGAKSVHIAAPGVKILSTTADGKYSDVVAKFKDAQGKENTVDWEGTSMATPIVAGAVALVWSKYPNADYHEIRDRILKSARAVPALAGKVSTGGVLDVSAALAR